MTAEEDRRRYAHTNFSRLSRQRLLKKAEGLPPTAAVLVSLIMIVVLGVLDVYTGTRLSLSLFYLAPVMFAVWLANRRFGMFVAVSSTLTWATIELLTAPSSTPMYIRGWNTALRFGFFLVVVYLLDDVKDAQTEMERLSKTDSLTGLCNHKEFYARVEQEIQRSRRHQKAFTLAYIDIDGFKAVNDSLGHLAGDDVLRLVARTLSSETRSVDVVGRLGGDEFAVLMPETDATSAPAVFDRLTTAVADRLQKAQIDVPALGFSIGAVAFYAPPESADAAIGLADRAMYEGRQASAGGVNLKIVTGTLSEVATAV